MKQVAVALLALVACTAIAQNFYKVQVIFFRSNDGKTYNPPKQITISDKAEIAKLVKFLPGLGYSKGGLKPGGWVGWGTIRLMRSKGPGIAVFFPSDGKVFSMIGKQGDFPATKGFKEYMLEIEKKAKQ